MQHCAQIDDRSREKFRLAQILRRTVGIKHTSERSAFNKGPGSTRHGGRCGPAASCKTPTSGPVVAPGDLLYDTQDSRAAAELMPPETLILSRCITFSSLHDVLSKDALRSATLKTFTEGTRCSGDLNRREYLSSLLTPILLCVIWICKAHICRKEVILLQS